MELACLGFGMRPTVDGCLSDWCSVVAVKLFVVMDQFVPSRASHCISLLWMRHGCDASVRTAGLEPATSWFVAKRSIQLNHVRLSIQLYCKRHARAVVSLQRMTEAQWFGQTP